MKSLICWSLVLALGPVAVPAFAQLKVATSLTDLASVAGYVGGEHVTAKSLCRGYEDPHFVPAKPSLMKAIQHADVFVSVGLELDSGWLPLVLPGSRNPKIQPGRPGFVDASEGIPVLEKPTGTVSRAEGDIHPLGNPHYYLDPRNLEIVADHLADVFSRLDPGNAEEYSANAKAFNERMETSLAEWRKQMEPFQGKPLVTYHKNFVYFANRFDLQIFGNVESKPGIPPSPRHIADLADDMKLSDVKVIVYEPYYNAAPCRELASKTGGTAVEIATEVGGLPDTDDVFAKFNVLVSTLATAFSETGATPSQTGGTP